MTNDASQPDGGVVDRKSKRARRRRPVTDYVAIVRPPGNPSLSRVFAADELKYAEDYAREHGAHVQSLPD